VSYVFPILFALATLALPELGWRSSEEHAWGTYLALLAPYPLAFAAQRALLRGRFRLGSLLERALAGLPVALQALSVSEFGWAMTLVRFGIEPPTLDEWLDLGLLWALAPFAAYQLATIDARARFLAFGAESPARQRVFQLRLFLSALLPLVAYLAGSSLLGSSEVWRVRFEEVGLLGGAMAVALVGLFVYGMPFFLRYAWDTAPFAPGWQRTTLERAANEAGFRYRELLQWRTGQQVSNAAIVGFTPRSRLVFFSDLLLAQLGPPELAAVFAHEMGHARRAHAFVFGAFALGFFLGAQQVLEWLALDGLLVNALVLGLVLALWYLAFGFLSRRFELEADLESLRVVGESAPLVRALELVTGAHAHKRSSWRHFSTHDRVSFLQRAERDPLVGIRLRTQLARWRKLGFTLFALAALLEVRSLAREWEPDWLVADLRLGRFEAALARADAPGVEPELAALARRGAQAPADARAPLALGTKALAAWNRDDRTAAREWLELARLRGARGLEPLIEALAEGAEGSDDLPRTWREALGSALAR
jgi:Zn-dependent protease with chaperone function